MILLDTNVLIDLPSGDVLQDETLGASILSRAELEFGVRVAPSARTALVRARYLDALDRTIDWLPFDHEATRAYGYVAAAFHARGAKGRARRTDAFIAAQAYALDVPLMTRNVDDFAGIGQLVRIIDPSPSPS